jgi:iron(III) transport system substrate-binding protein
MTNNRSSHVSIRILGALVALLVAGQMALASNVSPSLAFQATAAATMAATMTAPVATMAATAAAPAPTCDKATGLNLYAAIGYDADVSKIYTTTTGIPVNLVDDSTGPLLAKITAEGANPQWDVAWFDGDAAMQALDDAGLLAHWDSPSIANYTDLGLKVLPASHAYYPSGVTSASAIAYNTDKVKAMNLALPKDWNDLLNPIYKGLIVESNPSISGPSYQHIASIATIMGGVDKAKEYFTKLKANGLKIFDTSGPSLKQVTTGDAVFAIVQDAGVYGRINAGQPLAIIYPTSGVGVLPSVIAVSAKAAHLGCAQNFVNYILSAEGQNAIAGGDPTEGDRYYIPVIKGTQIKVKRQLDGINFVFLDIPAYAKIAADYKAWFRDNITQ